jgi:hypothetical protein
MHIHCLTLPLWYTSKPAIANIMLSSTRIVNKGISGVESEGLGVAVDFGNGVRVGDGNKEFVCCSDELLITS